LDEIILKKSINKKSFFSDKMTSLFNNLLEKKNNDISSERYYSLGSVLGAFLGDALGSYYEFQHGEILMIQN